MRTNRKGGTVIVGLFGETAPPEPKPKAAHPLAEWFEAIADLIGPTAARQAAGRVAKIAAGMKAAGVTPEEVRRDLPGVINHYAGWRKVIDITAVQCCWPWIHEPPRELGPTPPAERAAAVLGRPEGFAY